VSSDDIAAHRMIFPWLLLPQGITTRIPQCLSLYMR
jgi:hypothetical protein